MPKLTVDPKVICNTLIGSTITKNSNTNSTDFLTYCYPSLEDSLFCHPVTKVEIVCVSGFKSPGPNNIEPKLSKIILYDILEPLEHICTISFRPTTI